jgi:hypothetical protein
MTATGFARASLENIHPALVLAAYGEELYRGGRVAIFGDATVGLAEELIERGARLVHVYDSEPARVAEASARRHDRSIFYATLPEGGDIGVRDGTFDAVFIPDLTLLADPAPLVAVAERVLSSEGAALIASPNGETRAPLLRVPVRHAPLGYYELYGLLSNHFSSVRMLGQAPFVGYAVAEFAAEDPEPTIDTSLADTEGKDADWFIALASQREARLDAFALIEMPVLPWDASEETPADEIAASHNGPPALVEQTAEGTVLVDVVDAEREAALSALRQQEQLAKEERFRAEQATSELRACREENGLLRERCEAMKKALDDEQTLRGATEAELERVRHDPEAPALRERVQRVEEMLRHASEEQEREVGRLETQLRERGQQVQALEAEVTRREKLVREVVAGMPQRNDENGREGRASDLSARLDRMAEEAAKREADLVAARWRIAQLERELTQPR